MSTETASKVLWEAHEAQLRASQLLDDSARHIMLAMARGRPYCPGMRERQQ